MIVFISDLHISDHSVSTFNLPAAAFVGVFEDLRRHLANSGEADLRIVLLGDIFELIHTDYWLDVLDEECPWGTACSSIHACGVLQKVLDANEPIFSLFRGDLSRHFGTSQVSITYVPGNHDRLCNIFPGTRTLVREGLGLSATDPAVPFAWEFVDSRYGVCARHGHEYDGFNYGGGDELSAEAHALPAIGDVLTAMLAARLPRLVREMLTGRMPPDELACLSRNLGAMFDVRPLAALIPFLSYQVRSLAERSHRRAVVEAIRRAVRDCRRLPFVRRWIGHSGWQGRQLALLFWLLATFDVFAAGKCRDLVQRVVAVRERPGKDSYQAAAVKEFERLRSADVEPTHGTCCTATRTGPDNA